MPRKISSGKVGRSILGSIVSEDNSLQSVVLNESIVLSPNGTGIVESTTDFQLNATNAVRFADLDSSNYVALKAPDTVSSNVTLVLPAAAGNANDVLRTDANGNLSFTPPALTVTNRTAADGNTYYITMSDGTSGTEDTLSVASGRLEFVPNPGRLSAAEIRSTSSTASTTTSSGSLVVTGGVGVGGQLTAVTIVETSSIALKENIEPIQNGLDKILELVGVTYDRTDNMEHESGLIAEWTEKVLPDLVTRDDVGNVVGIKYTKLTAYLVEAIKTLKAEIDELKNK